MGSFTLDVSSFMLLPENQKAIKPDKLGIYRKVPIMVLGKASRNRNFYVTDSMIEAITSPRSNFYKALVAGQLEGEWGHPPTTNNQEADILRMFTIKKENVSHAIHRVYTEQPTDNGNVIVYADISCCGPYGNYLKDDFENPIRNTAFSLRSLSKIINQKDGLVYKTVTALVTIDTVGAPGYAEASKVCLSTEDLSIPVRPECFISEISQLIGVESVNDQELLDILQTDSVKVCHALHGNVDIRSKILYTKDGMKSVFHTVFDSIVR